MKNLTGNVKTRDGVPLPGVIVTGVINPNVSNTTTDSEGNFLLSVDDNETQVNFYAGFLESGNVYDTYNIPVPFPAVPWSVRLAIKGPEIISEPEKKKMNLWPVYAGLGLLALLLLRKMRKDKKKRK
jgi:hypothetical protein